MISPGAYCPEKSHLSRSGETQCAAWGSTLGSLNLIHWLPSSPPVVDASALSLSSPSAATGPSCHGRRDRTQPELLQNHSEDNEETRAMNTGSLRECELHRHPEIPSASR